MSDLNFQEKKKFRKLSFNEKIYTINEEISPAFAIQFVIEGEGLLEEELLRKSLLELTYKIPALQLKLKGEKWYFDEIIPKLIIHNKSFSNDLNSSIFKSKLSAELGRNCEIHAFQSNSTTLVVRVLHSLMDGIGVLNMIDTWFDLMNKINVKTCLDHPIEEDFKSTLSLVSTNKNQGFKFKWKGLENLVNIEKSSNYTTIVLEFDFHIESLIGKLAEWYVHQVEDSARFLIPVNIRRHSPNFKSFANLSLPVYLEANQTENAKVIQAKLLHEIQENNELAKNNLEYFGKITPSVLLKNIVKRKIKSAQEKNVFPMSGFLSDLGNVELNRLKTRHYAASNLYALPVHISLAPFCMLSCQHSNGTRIGLSLPLHYNSDSIRKSLTEFLQLPILEEDKKENFSENLLTLQLRKIWSEILEIDEVQIQFNATYSSYGGSSLNLLLLISKIEDEILKEKNKTFLSEVILLGGSMTISDIEIIIVKYQQS